MKEKIVKINKTKSWFFEKINKIDKTLARLNMPEDLENSAVATGLEKISFHSNSIVRQFQGKTMPNNVQTMAQFHSSHMLAK